MNITGANQFTSGIVKSDNQFVSVSIVGTFVANIVVQRKRVDEPDSAYRDIKTYTAPTQEDGRSAGGWIYRIGCKTGGYTSGTAVVDVF